MTNLLSDIFDLGAIRLNLDGKTKEMVFVELISAISTLHPECKAPELLAAIRHREEQMNTGIGSGIAVPHIAYKGINKMVGAIGVSQCGIDYEAMDKKPVHVVFLLITNEKPDENHLRVLNLILKLAQSEAFPQIRKAEKVETIYNILSNVHLAGGVV